MCLVHEHRQDLFRKSGLAKNFKLYDFATSPVQLPIAVLSYWKVFANILGRISIEGIGLKVQPLERPDLITYYLQHCVNAKRVCNLLDHLPWLWLPQIG